MIASEMATNRERKNVLSIRHFNDLCSDVGFLAVGDCVRSKEARLGTYMLNKASLGKSFCENCEWDHKPEIYSMIGISEGGGWVQIEEGFAVRGDVFSNMHYGYIMAFAGESLEESLRLANGESKVYERFGDFLGLYNLPETGKNGTLDDEAVTIGYNYCACPIDGKPDHVPTADGVRELLIANKDVLFDNGGACDPADNECIPVSQWPVGD